jgi:hypothetical protein
MAESELGTLSLVDPREIWKHEAKDFTPWLAKNLGHLGELLGLDLELTSSETSVGDFSADIVARDLGGDRVVVVENQLEATDHSHLGQIITYAAGLEAGVVVWLCREFREEHRQALDWLNRNETTEFFGVVIEVLRINNSLPAPNLRLVAAPNRWSRESKRSAHSVEPSEKGAAYKAFFQKLLDELREKHKFTNAKLGQAQNWYSFSAGIPGFKYAVNFASTCELRVELYIDFEDETLNGAAFDALLADKAAIEASFGAPLRRERLDGRRACRIAIYAPGQISDSADVLELHRSWAVVQLLRFKAVFGPRLTSLAKTVNEEPPSGGIPGVR